jgi:hypothetical protein
VLTLKQGYLSEHEMHFCSTKCLGDWAEKVQVNNSETLMHQAAIAGEYLGKDSLCYVDPSDGNAYRVKQKG